MLGSALLLYMLSLAIAQQLDHLSHCVDLSQDCPKRQSLCHNNLFEDLMREQCRKTCNFCDDETDGDSTDEGPGEEPFVEEPSVEETTHSSVEDVETNGEETENVPDPEFVEATHRPLQPSLKKVDTCVDRSYGCDGKRHLCHRPQYRSIMAKTCAKTCGFCGTNVNSPFAKGRQINTYPYSRVSKPHTNLVCRDASHDCTTRSHLCQNHQYAPLMKKLCRKTCKFC